MAATTSVSLYGDERAGSRQNLSRVDRRGFGRVEVRMLALLHAMVGEHQVAIGHDTLTRQAGARAGEHAAVERQDLPTTARGLHEPRDATADAGDAIHRGGALAIEADRQVIRHLGRARAPRARVHQRQSVVQVSHVTNPSGW